MPLCLQKRPTPLRQWARNTTNGFNTLKNSEPYYLLAETNTNVNIEDWGWGHVSGDDWDINKLGSVLVYQKDGKDITSRQVEVLVYYCQHELLPAMKPLASTVYDGNDRKEFIEENMCRAKFEKFFARYKQNKIEEGDRTWAMEVSPYSV
jgi:hypothetical protein